MCGQFGMRQLVHPSRGLDRAELIRNIPELEPHIRAALKVRAERDLARRTVPEAMAFPLVYLVVVLVTPYHSDYPAAVIALGCLMFLLGLALSLAGTQLMQSGSGVLFRWMNRFRGLIFIQFAVWGLFSALTLAHYRTEWTSMLVLLCTGFLASGNQSTLSPDFGFARWALLAIMAPSAMAALFLGTAESFTIAFLVLLHLSFLLLRSKQQWRSYGSTNGAAAREASRESDRLLTSAFENASVGMGLLDSGREILRVNRALCHMLGHTEEELLSAELSSFTAPEDLDIAREAVERLGRGEERLSFEQRFIQPGGRRVWGLVSVAAAGMEGANARYHLVMIQDITEQKKAHVRREATEAHRQVIQSGALDLNKVVFDMQDRLQRTLGEDIELVLHLSPGLRKVQADAGQMRQVILNLALHARDAMPGGGGLKISTSNIEPGQRGGGAGPGSEHAEPSVMLEVSDTGRGMDEETKSRVFESFFTAKETGTGTGLSTVYRLIHQLQGRIHLDSQPGKGTRFRIFLLVVLNVEISAAAGTMAAG